jgi:hypothetical protein
MKYAAEDYPNHKYKGNFRDDSNENMQAAWDVACEHKRTTSSKYVGVYFNQRKSKWSSVVSFELGKSEHLGYFEDEDDAMLLYDYIASFMPPRQLNQRNTAHFLSLIHHHMYLLSLFIYIYIYIYICCCKFN